MTITDAAFAGKPMPCRVIDAHTHIGPSFLNGWHQMAGEYDTVRHVALMDRLGFDCMVTAPHPILIGAMEEANRLAAEAAEKFPGRVYAYISVVPQRGMEAVKKELESYGNHPAFLGLKFLPGYYHGDLTRREYQYALDFADEMACPVLLHEWENEPPRDQIEDALKHRRRMKLIVAHQGGGTAPDTKAFLPILLAHENCWMELCGSSYNQYGVEDLAEMAGAERIIFGTDAVDLDPRYELGRVAFCPLSEADKEKVFAGNFLGLLEGSGMGRIRF